MSQPLRGALPSVRQSNTVADLGLSHHDRSVQPAWTVRRTRPYERPADQPVVMRRSYDIQWLAANGDIRDAALSAPALPVFESAFNAFARGALIPTTMGLVAIEDLLPGDQVETVEGDVQTVDWIGSMQIDTGGTRAQDAKPERLYRITADTFGLGRPAPDLILGAGARYLYRAHALKSYLGTAQALAPVPSLVDGVSVIEVTPMSSVRSYHIGLSQHRLIRVNGVALESYHPGTTASGQLPNALRAQFMTLFPHLDGLGAFGAMSYPRLSPTDLIMLDNA